MKDLDKAREIERENKQRAMCLALDLLGPALELAAAGIAWAPTEPGSLDADDAMARAVDRFQKALSASLERLEGKS
jgi:hypothetical protein